MLCPKCGADVGDEIRFCGECSAELEQRDARPVSAAEDTVDSDTSAGGDTVDATEDSDHLNSAEPGSRGPWIILVFLLLIAAASVYLIITFAFDSDGSADLVDSGQSEGTSSGEMVLPGPKNLSLTRGMVELGDVKTRFSDSVAIYHPLRNLLEIGFYRDSLSRTQLDELEKGGSLAQLNESAPGALFSLTLADGVTFCDPQSVTLMDVSLRREPGGLAQAAELSFSTGDSGIADLACQLEDDAPYRVTFRRSDEASGISWELNSSGRLMVAETIGNIDFNWTAATDQAAIWDKENNAMEVGYFGRTLLAEERLAIRREKSLNAIEGNPPAVSIRFDTRASPNRLAAEHLLRYGIVFRRGVVDGIAFPGSDDEIGFYYVPTVDSGKRLWGLGGYLIEGEPIQGGLTNSAEKRIGGVLLRFHWTLEFNTPLIDVNSEPIATSRTSDAVTRATDFDPGTTQYAKAAVGDLEVKFVTTLALYYPETGDLAVGFYTIPLTEAEKQEIRRRGFLWTFVNNKRPNLVLFFEFPHGTKQAAFDELLSYSAFFYRDKIGSFYFPGVHDRKSFKKIEIELTPEEIRLLTGELADGAEVKLSIKGENSSDQAGLVYSWDVNTTAPILAVQK